MFHQKIPYLTIYNSKFLILYIEFLKLLNYLMRIWSNNNSPSQPHYALSVQLIDGVKGSHGKFSILSGNNHGDLELSHLVANHLTYLIYSLGKVAEHKAVASDPTNMGD